MLPAAVLQMRSPVAPVVPVSVRGSRIALINGSSVVFTLPAGSAAGDLMLLFVGHGWGATAPSGWTELDNLQGSNWNGASFTKVLTSGDISTGSVTVSFGGSFNGVVAGITFVGAPYIREFVSSRNGTGSTSRSLITAASVQTGEYAVSFGSARINGACTDNLGAQLQQTSGANGSGVLNGGDLVSSGAATSTFTYPATPTGDYQAVFVLRTAARPSAALQFVGGKTFTFAADGVGNASVSLTDLTGGLAAAPAEGDLVMVGYGSSNGSLGPGVGGFVEISALSNGCNMSTMRKRMLATPDTQVTVKRVNSNSGISYTGVVHVWRGVNEATPDDVAQVTATSASTDRADPPSITPSSGAVAVFMGVGASGGVPGNPTSSDLDNFFGLTSNNTADANAGGGSKASTGSAINPTQFGGTAGTSGTSCMIALALRPS